MPKNPAYFDRRIFIGMLLIVVAGAPLSWEQIPVLGVPWGALAIMGACLCWAIDNKLTRKVSASDHSRSPKSTWPQCELGASYRS